MTNWPIDYQGKVNGALLAKHAVNAHPGGGLMTDTELAFLETCHTCGFTPERCAQEILFTRLCNVVKIHSESGYQVVWGGEICTPQFADRGAALACLSMYATGYRKPELPATSDGLHSEGTCWGIWRKDATGLIDTCNRCGEERA